MEETRVEPTSVKCLYCLAPMKLTSYDCGERFWQLLCLLCHSRGPAMHNSDDAVKAVDALDTFGVV